MLWTLVGLVPIVGPVVATVGKAVMVPMTMGMCWLMKQPDYVVSATCVMLSGKPCQ